MFLCKTANKQLSVLSVSSNFRLRYCVNDNHANELKQDCNMDFPPIVLIAVFTSLSIHFNWLLVIVHKVNSDISLYITISDKEIAEKNVYYECIVIISSS